MFSSQINLAMNKQQARCFTWQGWDVADHIGTSEY
jgi:hypothetical protein